MALPVVERTARCLMARLACQLAGQVLLAPAAGAASPGPPAAASTPAAAPRITLHANMNNVAGSPWRESQGSVKYLGLYNTSEQCAWACMRGPPPRGSGHCCAFTFHTKDYEPDEPGGWNRQCFSGTESSDACTELAAGRGRGGLALWNGDFQLFLAQTNKNCGSRV